MSVVDQIDLLAIGFLVLLASVSARRGIILAAYDFVSGLLVLVIAVNTYRFVGAPLAPQVQLTASQANLDAFLVLLVIGEVIRLRVGAVFSNIDLAVSDNSGFSDIFNTLGAMFFGLVRGAYYIALIIIIVNAVPALTSWREPVARAGLPHAIQAIFSSLLPADVVPTDYSTVVITTSSGAHPVSGEPLPTTVGVPGRPDPKAESQLLDMTNLARRQDGLPPLVLDPQLNLIASEHTMEMSKLALLFHDSPTTGSISDRLRSANIPFRRSAENVAYSRALEFAFAGLMFSPEHRGNILSSDLHRIGVGVSQTDPAGLLLTQDFAD